MRELLVDFITSLDGYASGEGWPGWWGLQGPEYLAWLEKQPEVTYLMGANTYRLMSGFAAGEMPEGTDEFSADEQAAIDLKMRSSKACVAREPGTAPRRWACTRRRPGAHHRAWAHAHRCAPTVGSYHLGHGRTDDTNRI
jgi:hypothetical protein